MPANLLPLQSGVGNIAKAVLFGLEEGPFDDLASYTEVIQDGMIAEVRQTELRVRYSIFAESGMRTAVNANMANCWNRIILRPAGDFESSRDHPPPRRTHATAGGKLIKGEGIASVPGVAHGW